MRHLHHENHLKEFNSWLTLKINSKNTAFHGVSVHILFEHYDMYWHDGNMAGQFQTIKY